MPIWVLLVFQPKKISVYTFAKVCPFSIPKIIDQRIASWILDIVSLFHNLQIVWTLVSLLDPNSFVSFSNEIESKHISSIAKREKSHFNSKRSICFLLERFVQLKMWWKMSRSRADALCLLINEAPLNRSAALCLSFDQQQLQQNEMYFELTLER